MKRLLGWTLLTVLAFAGPAGATCGGGGGGGRGGIAPGGDGPPQVYVVPWKVWSAQEPAPSQGLTLYWFSASAEEVKGSELRASRTLSLVASQCVTLLVVAPGANPLTSRYDLAQAVPAALLAGPDGAELGRVGAVKGGLRLADVEKLVRDTLKQREQAVDQKREQARARQKAGDKAAAIPLLRGVWDERCLFPKKGKDAAKELEKLGAPVADADPGPTSDASPIYDEPLNSRVAELMQRGLDAEEAAHYEDARSIYQQARELDPADPTPLRYLGELLRHHIGEWDAARVVFEALLAMRADPLSRAVAQHGLGKMTIHAGRFAEGLALLEASVASYPLPLAYRNLAVYWNSEGQPAKADGYVKKALALDPTDPFNLVFAATYLAAGEGRDEAVKIARANLGLMPASYNLAAIYALAGQRDQALALLKRHFNEYERYPAVRKHEMLEARVDVVFVSLRQDPTFVELTKLADAANSMTR